jgi:hypothetical protein
MAMSVPEERTLAGRYLLSPHYSWSNPSVALTDEQDAIGLLTGDD